MACLYAEMSSLAARRWAVGRRPSWVAEGYNIAQAWPKRKRGAIDLHLLQARREGQQGVRSQVRSRHLRGTSRSRISLDSANWTELDHISPIKQPMSELDDISPINRIAADTDSFYTPSDNRNELRLRGNRRQPALLPQIVNPFVRSDGNKYIELMLPLSPRSSPNWKFLCPPSAISSCV